MDQQGWRAAARALPVGEGPRDLFDGGAIEGETGGLACLRRAPLALPELNRRLLAERVDALLAVSARLDPDLTEGHFPEARWYQTSLRFPNHSTLRILRGPDAPPGYLAGLELDIAVVLRPWPERTLSELLERVLGRNGTLFAPFAHER